MTEKGRLYNTKVIGNASVLNKARLAIIFSLGILSWALLSNGEVLPGGDTALDQQGLVAYYPFNGNADDSSGNMNHGIVYGPTLTYDRFGNPNSAYSFDGTDDRIIVPDDDNLDITNAITLMAWIKTEASTGLQPVVVKRNLTTIDFAYCLDIGPGTVRGMFRVDDSSLYGAVRWSYGQTGIIADVWQHIAVTYDGESIRIYVNAQLDSTDSYSPSYPIVVSNDSLEIGYYSSAAGVYFEYLLLS